MKSRSSKAKGRKLVAELREAVLAAFPDLEPEDIILVPTSMGGEDLKLSPKARRCFPFSVECKNRETLNVWAAIRQAEANSGGHPPAVVFRRNGHPTWVAVSLGTMLDLLRDVEKYWKGIAGGMERLKKLKEGLR